MSRLLMPVKQGPTLLWNEYVHRYHPGLQNTLQSRYFIVSVMAETCLLFAAAAWALASRDEWIGWNR